jgi:nicotinamide mononucleotide transporter
MSPLEIVSNVFNLLGVVLATRNRVESWPVGIVGNVLYGILFYETRLYADVTLQAFYVITAIYGWWHWTRGGESRAEALVTRARPARLALYAALALAVTLGYGLLLREYTNAAAPFWDSLILAFSVLAQLLLMMRVFENWHAWVVVNVVAVPLYASKDLKLTSFVYFLFLINAFIGLRLWRRILRDQAAAPAA